VLLQLPLLPFKDGWISQRQSSTPSYHPESNFRIPTPHLQAAVDTQFCKTRVASALPYPAIRGRIGSERLAEGANGRQGRAPPGKRPLETEKEEAPGYKGTRTFQGGDHRFKSGMRYHITGSNELSMRRSPLRIRYVLPHQNICHHWTNIGMSAWT